MEFQLIYGGITGFFFLPQVFRRSWTSFFPGLSMLIFFPSDFHPHFFVFRFSLVVVVEEIDVLVHYVFLYQTRLLSLAPLYLPLSFEDDAFPS